MYTERPYTSFPKFCEGRQKAQESAKARHARDNIVLPLAATPVEKDEFRKTNSVMEVTWNMKKNV